MNIENEKDLQVWFELYKAILIDSVGATLSDCASLADSSFNEYKKRSKALEEALEEDSWIGWYGGEAERHIHPVGSVVVEAVYRDGRKDRGHADEFSWTHLGTGGDIVKFKFV